MTLCPGRSLAFARPRASANRIAARLLIFFAAILISSAAFAQGRINGVVKQKDGTPIGGAVVVLNERGSADVTSGAGKYGFDSVAAGKYTITITIGDHSANQAATVAKGDVDIETIVDWPLAFADTVTVTGVSKHVERIVESPAAVTRIDGADLAREAVDPQLPRRLARVPGIELVQASLFTFSLNTRGFNTNNGRHFPVFIDGRDASTPVVLGNQEWGAIPVPLDQLASVEVVRGPAAALYGSGAFSGVVNLITKSPEEARGGRARITFGQLHTFGGDAQYSASSKTGWSYRVTGATQHSRDFTMSRFGSVEYPGLTKEAIELPAGDVQTLSGSARIDYAMSGRHLVLEGGSARMQNILSVTSLGRSLSTDVRRPWARANFNFSGWNFMAAYTGRDAMKLVGLSTGSLGYLAESNVAGEAQYHRMFARGRGQLVAGASIARQGVDSSDPSGAATIFVAKESARQEAAFAQIDWNVTAKLKAVASGRWDDSTLHDGQFSPRAAVTFSPAQGQTFRANYSHAFQSPSLVEFFLRAPVAPPLDLSALQTALSPILGGTALGFAAIPMQAVGNAHMTVERIETYEAGYTGVLGRKVMATASVFYNRRHDFTTNLVPQTGSSLGRINPDFQPYQPPAALSATASAAVLNALKSSLPAALYAAMSNDATGKPVFALLTFGNFGEATDRGVELGLTAWVRPEWRVESSVTLMSFNVKSQAAESVISPNVPSRQFSAGTTYAGRRFSASGTFRAVNAFDWNSGVYVGPVPAYAVVDAAAGFTLQRGWRIDVDAANLLDHRHIELFGGSLLGRRVLGSLVYTW